MPYPLTLPLPATYFPAGLLPTALVQTWWVPITWTPIAGTYAAVTRYLEFQATSASDATTKATASCGTLQTQAPVTYGTPVQQATYPGGAPTP